MVDNLKDLEKLLKLCRKQGVTEINLGSVAFKLGDLPVASSNAPSIDEIQQEFEASVSDEPMSAEEIMQVLE